MDAEARKQNKLVGNQKDRGKTELAALRESLKAQARGDRRQEGQGGLEQIQKRYGNAELQRAIREFNITFQGHPARSRGRKEPRGMASPMFAEFCPRCGTPVDTSGDEMPLL